MNIIDAVQVLVDTHAGGAHGKQMDGVVAVFSAEDPWVDDEDIWPWQLADATMDSSPYYWGVTA